LDERLQAFPPLTLDDNGGERAFVTLGDASAAAAAHADLLRAARAPCAATRRCVAPVASGSWVRAQLAVDAAGAPAMFAAPAPLHVPAGREYGPNASTRGLGVRYYVPVTDGLLWLPRANGACCAAPPPSRTAAGAVARCLDRAATLRGRGDSHSRVMYNGLMARACGRAVISAISCRARLCG
jgi:hypothetical protein